MMVSSMGILRFLARREAVWKVNALKTLRGSFPRQVDDWKPITPVGNPGWGCIRKRRCVRVASKERNAEKRVATCENVRIVAKNRGGMCCRTNVTKASKVRISVKNRILTCKNGRDVVF